MRFFPPPNLPLYPNQVYEKRGWTDIADFLGKEYSGLVQYKIAPVSGMLSFSSNYTEEQLWAYPDLDHAIELMRKAANV